MRYIRVLVVVLFFLSLGGYAGLRIYNEQIKDDTPPVISCDQDSIRVSVKDKEEVLLQGLSATDDRDGDLTGQIVIESKGPFLSDGSRKINYAVCDNSNNIGHYTRTLTYKDYQPPRFELSQQLRFSAGEDFDVLEYLTATDVLDGNLTNRIRLTHGYIYSQPDAGTYSLGYQVSNSAGDDANIELLVEVCDPEKKNYLPSVELSDYVVYIKKGKNFNPYRYIEDVALGNRKLPINTDSSMESAKKDYQVTGLFGDLSNKGSTQREVSTIYYNDIYLDNPVDTETPGAYNVTYSITTEDGYTGTTGLSVIVYE